MQPTTTPVVASRPAAQRIDVAHAGGEAYEIRVRGHRIRVDQPTSLGGGDSAPTPTELFVASLASCVAFYTGRYLVRHGHDPAELQIHTDFTTATDRPTRVAAIDITLRLPDDVPTQRHPAIAAVASHCTIHNTLTNPPDITLTVE